MPRRSAGLLMYRLTPEGSKVENTIEVFLVHPGGPYFAHKDAGYWTIPKGEYETGESPLEAAQREFTEETGFPSAGPFHDLGTVRQNGGKIVSAWAFEGDCDPTHLTSNTCLIIWPPKSGRTLEIPEVDRGNWFSLPAAQESMRPDQLPYLHRLQTLIATLVEL